MDLEVEARAKDILPQKSSFLCLFQGDAKSTDRQWILGTDIDIALGCPYTVTGDGQSLDNSMWVSLQDGAIHEGPGVAFVGIADNVFLLTRGVAAELPFPCCGEAGTASSPEAGLCYLINDRFRCHLKKSLLHCLVPTMGNIVVDLLGVNVPAISQDNALLFLVKLYV